MIRPFFLIGSLFGVVLLSSCFGQHNNAPNPGVNLADPRIYGVSREAEPKQLKNEYDPESKERINNIRDKMFPN